MSATKYVRSLERALAAMRPPIEVYGGILRIIAEYVSGEFEKSSHACGQHKRPTWNEWIVVVRFQSGGSNPARFAISNGGETATRVKGGRSDHPNRRWGFILVSPSFSEGASSTRRDAYVYAMVCVYCKARAGSTGTIATCRHSQSDVQSRQTRTRDGDRRRPGCTHYAPRNKCTRLRLRLLVEGNALAKGFVFISRLGISGCDTFE